MQNVGQKDTPLPTFGENLIFFQTNIPVLYYLLWEIMHLNRV